MSANKRKSEVKIGDGGAGGENRDRLGLLFLEKNTKSKRNPRKTEKVNTTRGCLTKQEKKAFKFEDVVKLNSEWQKYYRDRLGSNFSGKKHDKSILKADYHGAMLTIWMAENPTQIGISGIVVLETRHTFQLVTPDDRFLVIPKKGSAFRFMLGDRIFTLFGEGMRTRPAWRGKKPRVKRVLPIFIRGTLAPVPDGGDEEKK